MKKNTILILFTLLVFSCTTVKLSEPSQADLARANKKYPNYSLDELSQGKVMYEKNCATCHSLKNPKSESEKEWNAIVPKMVSKINKDTVKLDNTQQDLILKYLIIMSSKK